MVSSLISLTNSLSRLNAHKHKPAYQELHNTIEHQLIQVDLKKINFVVVILDSLLKTGFSGTQRYLINSRNAQCYLHKLTHTHTYTPSPHTHTHTHTRCEKVKVVLVEKETSFSTTLVWIRKISQWVTPLYAIKLCFIATLPK